MCSVCHIFFIHSSSDSYFCFLFLTVMNNTAYKAKLLKAYKKSVNNYSWEVWEGARSLFLFLTKGIYYFLNKDLQSLIAWPWVCNFTFTLSFYLSGFQFSHCKYNWTKHLLWPFSVLKFFVNEWQYYRNFFFMNERCILYNCSVPFYLFLS